MFNKHLFDAQCFFYSKICNYCIYNLFVKRGSQIERYIQFTIDIIYEVSTMTSLSSN